MRFVPKLQCFLKNRQIEIKNKKPKVIPDPAFKNNRILVARAFKKARKADKITKKLLFFLTFGILSK